MSDSTGCKILATALVVAIIMGGLGFITGFLTHTVLVADGPDAQSAVVIEVTATPQAVGEPPSPTPNVETLPTSPSQSTAQPTPVPTIEIPPETGRPLISSGRRGTWSSATTMGTCLQRSK